jgi:hypothetical protein
MFEQDAKLVGKVGCFEEGRCRINRECITYSPGLETREYEILQAKRTKRRFKRKSWERNGFFRQQFFFFFAEQSRT